MSEWAGNVKHADKWFSRLIRLTHADDDLIAACVTCDIRYPITKLHCGHFVDRGVWSTRWVEQNAAVQCYSCNVSKSGNKLAFVRYVYKEYGPIVLGKLLQADLTRNSAGKRPSAEDVRALADFIRSSCEKCAEDKGINLKTDLNWR